MSTVVDNLWISSKGAPKVVDKGDCDARNRFETRDKQAGNAV